MEIIMDLKQKKIKIPQRGLAFMAIVFVCTVITFTDTGCGAWYAKYGINKGQIRSREVLPNLIQALDDPNPRTRRSSLQLISRLKLSAQDAIPKVVEIASSDEDKSIRHYAINVLRMIMPFSPENKDLLKEVAKANAGELAVEAENILEYIGGLEGDDSVSYDNGKINIADGMEITLTPEFTFYNGYVTIQPSRTAYMLPIEIEINNHTNATFSLNADSFILSGADGKQRAQLSVAAAVKRQQYDIGAAVFRGLVILGPIPAVKAGRANGIISKFCEAKVLTTLDVQPGEQIKKTIFFDCPQRPDLVVGWQLSFDCLQKDCGLKNHVKYIFGAGAQIITEEIIKEHQVDVCGTSQSLENKLLTLQELKDKNLITESEYIEKRRLLIKEY